MGEELVEGRRGSWEEKGRRKGGRGQPKDRGRRGEKRRARGCFHKNPPDTVLWVRAITNMHRMVRAATLINEHCGIAHTCGEIRVK